MYPYLIEQFKDNMEILETLFGSCKTPEYVTKFLSICHIPKPKNFALIELEQPWEPYSAIGMYNEGKLTIDDMRQWFYYNAGLSCIQTINVVQGTRVIETITWNFPLIEELDVYCSAYMEDRKPNYIPKNLEILTTG
jgi:hypothetical protein